MSTEFNIEWPTLEAGYEDEYGVIDAEVYAAAVSLWPRAVDFARFALHDTQPAHALLMKAAANATRAISAMERKPGAEAVRNLQGYLFTSYKRLIIEEKGKRERIELVDSPLLIEKLIAKEHSHEDFDRKILLKEIIRKMDPQMREIYEKLAIGYSYKEIAAMRNESADNVRVRFHRHLHELIDRIRKEEGSLYL